MKVTSCHRFRDWLVGFSCFILLSGLPWVTLANEPNILREVQVTTSETTEQIEILFEQDVESAPIIDFDRGLMYLRLVSVTLDTPARQFVFPETSKVVKLIRANQNATSTQLEVILHASHLSLENKLDVSWDGPRLLLTIDRSKLNASPNESAPANELAEEVQQRLQENEQLTEILPAEEPKSIDYSDTLPSTFEQPEESWITTILTLLLSLLLIFGVLYLLLYFYNKVLSGRFPALQGKFSVKTVATFHLGPKQRIVVLEVNEQYFACGVTPSNISFLMELADKEDQSFLGQVSVSKDKVEIHAEKARADFLKTLHAARKQAQQMAPAPEEPAPEMPPPASSPTEVKTGKKNVIQSAPPAAKSKVSETAAKHSTSSALAHERESGMVSPPKKSFQTAISPEATTSLLEKEFTKDDSMQQFAKQLGKKLKSLKPID